ncbi:very long chain fatty acid elongase AAEL008004-like isoform X1 [Rhopilema esculentum]|uniref:very long chain fatty acid elongase AAEL008004-like isoform X1 n=1 Tax=Rhopilema esculentum TaxID=499914 RepID=UPI0031E42B5E
MAGQYLIDLYRSARDSGDPRTENMLLVREPLYVVGLILAYLFIVIKGPQWMAKREGFELRKPLIVYNFFLVALSGWMMYEFFVTTVLNPTFNFWCEPVNPSDVSDIQMRQIRVSWVYFISKIIEFMDTFFFILRKKSRQITFLHVYHHTSVLMMQWLVTKHVPGAIGCLAGMLNCFIHVVMYSYYMLAAFGPHMQKYLWWKRYLTKMQIIQFVLVFLHTSYAIQLDCGFSKGFLWSLWLYMLTLFMLFSHFYKQAYTVKPKDKKME